MDKGEVFIPYSDIIESKFADHLATRYLMKEKGVPMNGTFYPDFISGYEYTREESHEKQGLTIKWKKK